MSEKINFENKDEESEDIDLKELAVKKGKYVKKDECNVIVLNDVEDFKDCANEHIDEKVDFIEKNNDDVVRSGLCESSICADKHIEKIKKLLKRTMIALFQAIRMS